MMIKHSIWHKLIIEMSDNYNRFWLLLNRIENNKMKPTSPIVERIVEELDIPSRLIIKENIKN